MFALALTLMLTDTGVMTVSTTANGTLGGQEFSGLITFQAAYDTDEVVFVKGPDAYEAPMIYAVVSVPGFDDAEIIDPGIVYAMNYGAQYLFMDFRVSDQAFVAGGEYPQWPPYDLSYPLDWTTVTLLLYRPQPDLDTSAGTLHIDYEQLTYPLVMVEIY